MMHARTLQRRLQGDLHATKEACQTYMRPCLRLKFVFDDSSEKMATHRLLVREDRAVLHKDDKREVWEHRDLPTTEAWDSSIRSYLEFATFFG